MCEDILSKVSDALIQASTVLRPDKIEAYKQAVAKETNTNAKYILEMILENALVAHKNKSPLCDDTGIPHLFLEVGKKRPVTGEMLEMIRLGVADGLRKLPGRPMAVIGDDIQRINQFAGLSEDPGMVAASPMLIKEVDGDKLRLYILMLGGGPAIRAKTYRVFHKHNIDTVKDEIIIWAIESAAQLGCTPCTLAVGVGRSHYEAVSLMMEAQVYGRYDTQNEMEREITDRVNQSHIGVLGLGGQTTVLATFIKVGAQRASGVRIVCMRPCCCFEPRIGSVDL